MQEKLINTIYINSRDILIHNWVYDYRKNNKIGEIIRNNS